MTSSDDSSYLVDHWSSGAGLLVPPTKIHRKPVPSPSPQPKRSRSYTTKPTTENHDNRYIALKTSDTEQHGVIGDPPMLTLGSRKRFFQAMLLWKWEFLSLITAIAAFIVIIIILRIYEGQELSSWKIPISINAIVAILSALFKGSLTLPISVGLSQLKWLAFLNQYQSLADIDVYDRASRGAWGSVLFIATQFSRRRVSILASSGAFLTLITLAVDPFSQASVSVYSCVRTVSKSGIIPRASNYSMSGGHSGAGRTELDSAMQNAVLSGLYQPPKNSSISMSTDVTCSTGNCTFLADDGASFATLTMCHSCLDVSDSVKRTSNGTYTLEWYDYMLAIGADIGVGLPVVFTTAASDGFPGENITQPFPDGPWSRTSLADFQGLALIQKNQSCDGHCETIPFAFDCSLRPCVKTFAASISNSIYREQELSREYLHSVPQEFYYQLAVNRTFLNATWKNCEGARERSETHTVEVILPEAQNLSVNDPLPSLWYPSECTYYISQAASSAIAEYMASLFQGSLLKTYPPGVPLGDAWLKSLWNWGILNMSFVDTFAEGLATSVGAQIRRNGDPPNNGSGIPPDIWTSVQGQVLHTGPCIQVRWKYLSFLAILLAAELLFFTAVIIVNYRSHWDRDWKSSTLPLLFQNIQAQEPIDKENRPAEDGAALYKTAKIVEATFSQVNGRWKLSAKTGTSQQL